MFPKRDRSLKNTAQKILYDYPCPKVHPLRTRLNQAIVSRTPETVIRLDETYSGGIIPPPPSPKDRGKGATEIRFYTSKRSLNG